MKQPSIRINLTHEGNMKFQAQTGSGLTIPIEPVPALGGSGTVPNPIEYLISSLGGCVSVHVILGLKKAGIIPDSYSVTIEGTRAEAYPTVFEKIHILFLLSGIIDEKTLADTIQKTITLLCPIAVTMGSVGETNLGVYNLLII